MNTVGTLSECMLVYPCHALIFVTDMFHKAIMKLANICEIGINFCEIGARLCAWKTLPD